MIKVNEEWAFDKDKHCWVLHHTIQTEKGPKIKKVYPGRLHQVFNHIIENSCGDVEDVEGLRSVLEAIHERNMKVCSQIEAVLRKKVAKQTEDDV